MSERLAVDIGGTFVDAIRFDREAMSMELQKVPTTPEAPTEGVTSSIEAVDAQLGETEAFIHGTTLGINALLEREGAETGIITNENFRDVFEIGRFDVAEEEMYNIHYEKPDQLVPRRQRVGVPGRLDEEGDVLEPLDADAVRDAAEYLVERRGVSSIAICFLHAYQNPEHERRAYEVVREQYPDLTVSISSDITREYREYERTSTTVIDAYIKPTFEAYVDELDSSLRANGFEGPFFVTRSGGGALSAEQAKTAPVETILSGPAGGLIGAAHVGEAIDRDDVIAVDMGGTSLDACVIEGGTPAVAYQSELEHHPLLIPVYDIRTIGAGGGSIAWVDGDLLKVGPQSAGADPGPICYGRGGTDPTVTDAALTLGYIDPGSFLGGDMQLDEEAAIGGIERELAGPLGNSIRETSEGVFEVALANTVSAIREITVEKGLDPRDFSMIAYGGAGPMFNPLLARRMGVDEVIIPQAPSVFSAWGMLVSDVVYDFSLTEIELLEETGVDEIDGKFEELEADAANQLRTEGFDRDEIDLERSIEMRYLGQEHTVEIPAAEVGNEAGLRERFEARHDARYGHTMEDPAEVVHFRIRGIGRTDKPELDTAPSGSGSAEPTETREAYCFAREGMVPFDVYSRDSLSPGTTVDGPAIVREPTTTIVFHSDQHAEVDEYGHLIIGGSQ